MAQPLDGGQNRRGQYVGPQNALVRATSLAAAIIAVGIVLLGLDAVVALIVYIAFFHSSHSSYAAVYFLCILGTLVLISGILVLESLTPHADE